MSNSIEGLILILVVAALVAAFMLFIRHDASYAHGNAFGRHLNFAQYGWGGMIHKPGIPESRQTYISDILQYATWKKTTADEIDCWKNTTNHRRQMKCETAKRGAVTAYYDGTCW